MGTNYYLFTRSKNLAQRYFATNNSWGVSDEEYVISDEPLLGYYIHLMIETTPIINLSDYVRTLKSYTTFHIWKKYSSYLSKCFWKEKTLDTIQHCCIIISRGNTYDNLKLRKKTGLSQSQFAKRFHLNVRTVQTWEQGTRKTPDYVIWLITRVIELEEIINVKRDGI